MIVLDNVYIGLLAAYGGKALMDFNFKSGAVKCNCVNNSK